MKTKIVEYLGLPGVGKTWNLGSKGYCGQMKAHPHSVGVGKGWEKSSNTLRGVFYCPHLFLLLAWSWLLNIRSFKRKIDVRPILVVFERIGRIRKLSESEGKLIHIDEGPFQFLWRAFCEKEINKRNVDCLKRCIEIADLPSVSVAYLSCSHSRHFAQITKRDLTGLFDNSMKDNNETLQKRCRNWMAILIRLMRCSGIKIKMVRT